MQEAVKQRMSTGISSLDPILDGGVPPGSVILLLGDLGAGNSEFVYSSMVNNLDPGKNRVAERTTGPKGDLLCHLYPREGGYQERDPAVFSRGRP